MPWPKSESQPVRTVCRLALLFVGLLMLSACAETQFLIHTAKRMNQSDQPPSGNYKVGNPYQIDGIWYYPKVDYEYDETGIASWYGPNFHGKTTANGEIYDMNALTAAHRTLPMPSIVEVTNLENGRKIRLTVNDRGPYAKGRIIDISRKGAQLLGFQVNGTAKVRVRVLADESRALARQIQGGDLLAQEGTPITVEKLPKAGVDAQALPAPGEEAAPPPQPASAEQQVAALELPQTESIRPAEEVVTVEPVSTTSVFIQAGAFSQFDNANRASAILANVGSVNISPVLINGRDLFRVRVGPVATIEQADMLLEQVIAAGYVDARIIVD